MQRKTHIIVISAEIINNGACAPLEKLQSMSMPYGPLNVSKAQT